jgi:hypothetical protein
MPQVNTDWKVPRHGPIEQFDEGVATVSAEIRMPLGKFPRRMTIVALSGNRTAIWSAIPLAEPQMREIEAMGEPAFLIVPGIAHRLDLKPWKRRYPKALVLCPPGAAKAVEEVVHVDTTGDALADPTVAFETVPGTGDREAALIVRRPGGTTLIVNDILANIRHPGSFGTWVMARLLGFGTKHPRVSRTARSMLVKNPGALASKFQSWAEEPNLRRIIVSHGDVITDAAPQALGHAARQIAG